jgi:hemerythrin-like domain-containing protein
LVDIVEFSRENQELADLRAVLDVLVLNAELRSNAVFCELLARFSNKIRAHLDHEDRSVYAQLLNHEDRNINQVANQFMNNTHQLRQILSSYIKRWCRQPGADSDAKDHEVFLSETRAIFHLVDERIRLETNKLFPALQNA